MTLPQLMKMRDDALRLARYHEREAVTARTQAEKSCHFGLIEAYRANRSMVGYLINTRPSELTIEEKIARPTPG